MAESPRIPPASARDRIAHPFTGRLVDEKTGKPLSRFIVQAFDLDAGSTPADLGFDITDERGLFTLRYFTARQAERTARKANRRRLRFQIFDRRKREILVEETTLADRKQILEIRIARPAAPEPPSPSIHDLSIELPHKLQDFFANRETPIRTLADVRREGGLGHLAGLPVGPDHRAIRDLEAHASLSVLSSKVALNSALINAGFRSVAHISRTPRSEFVRKLRQAAGGFKAAQLHVQAKAQARFLSNVLVGLKSDWANGLEPRLAGITNPHIPHWFRRTCACDDCEAAVSPIAYLADLLDYTVHHLRNDDEPIDVEFLTDTFHQPFGGLTADCDTLKEEVRQARIAAEVLRSFRGSALGGARRHAYCLAAYEDLLTRLGTTYSELRLARMADCQTRDALAGRLGISTGNLNELTLQEDGITEQKLEDLFGLLDYRRNPFEERPAARFQTWRRTRLEQYWREEDRPVDAYTEGESTVDLASLPAEVNFPQSLQDKIRYDAACATLHFQGVMTIPGRDRLIGLSAESEYQEAIRLLFAESQRPPLIDPDVVGPDDFRRPEAGQRVFDLWRTRRTWVDDRIAFFSGRLDPNAADLLARVITAMREAVNDLAPWEFAPEAAEFPRLLFRLTRDTADEAQSARRTIQSNLHLTPESFIRLMEIVQKAEAWQVGIGLEQVTDEQRRDLHSILTQASKVALFPLWRAVELEQPALLLGAQGFWIPVREPKDGDWPPERNNRPWIDPEAVDIDGLPEATAGADALRLWKERWRQVQDNRDRLRRLHEAAGVELGQLLADELPRRPDAQGAAQHWSVNELTALANQLDSNDPAQVEAAVATISGDMHVSREAFERLMMLREKSENPDPAKRPSTDEREEVYAVLTTARKEAQWFSEPDGWSDVEHTAGLDVQYWRAVKARLPRWRASVETRQQWLNALRARSRRPIIDPDVLRDVGYLSDPFSGPARDIYLQRSAWVDERCAAIRIAPEHAPSLDEVDAAVRDSVGVSAVTLAGIEKDADDGADISGRLQQLSLSHEAFRYLRRGRRLAETRSILSQEWEDVCSILVQAEKQRLFANWRDEERRNDVSLAPSHFKIPEPPPLEFPPPEPDPLPEWRASRRDLREWEQRLQSRIDQQAAVDEGLRAAVSATEEATLPMLRDLLIDATQLRGPDAPARDAKARWLADRLLIDTRAGGCQITTRVTQAIETLQGVLWSLRTGLLAKTDDRLRLTLEAEDFDQEWEWMGSYATWRAAMFVFVYPENVLLPSLRPRQTPAFRTLVNDLRAARSLTPEQCCDAAAAYYEYFEDVCNLQLEAARTAWTRLHKGSGCEREAGDFRTLTYLFARPAHKTSVYWSSFYAADGSGYAQSFWDRVPGLENVSRIVGVEPFRINPQEWFLYLFVRTESGGAQKLMYSRYDLHNQAWANEPNELELPEDATSFEATVIRRVRDDESWSETTPSPTVRIKVGDVLYERDLNAEGNAWAEGDWLPVDRWWGTWTTLPAPDDGVRLGNAVTAVARDAEIHVFVVDEDGRARTISSNDRGTWNRWTPLGNQAFAPDTRLTPICPDSDELFVLGAAADGGLYWIKFDGNAWADDWEQIDVQTFVQDVLGGETVGLSLGAPVTAIKRAVDDGYELHVFVTAADGRVFNNRLDVNGDWRRRINDIEWIQVGIRPIAADSEITAIKTSSRYICLFAKDEDDVRINAWNASDENGAWRNFANEEEVFPGTSVTAILRAQQIEMFATTNEGNVRTATSKNPDDIDSWTWTTISGLEQVRFVPEPGLAAIKTVGERAHLFSVGSHGNDAFNLYGTWAAPELNQGDWNQWLPIGGDAAASMAPANRVVVLRSSDQIHLFRVGEDRSVYHNESQGWPVDRSIRAELMADYNLPGEDVYKPHVVEPFSLRAPQSESALQTIRLLVEDAFQENDEASPANVAYLEEAYYFVPVHLALQLQAAGQYVAALDWFRTVFDYAAASDGHEQHDHRKISYVIAREKPEESGDAEFSRPDEWLLDPLNPHAIATTRRGTYTRFTLMSLVRCLLEYGDAEFTRDTAESVPRARMLYSMALALLDTPELKQEPKCDDPRVGFGEDVLPDDRQGRRWRPAWDDIVSDLFGFNDAAERVRSAQEVLAAMEELNAAGQLLPLSDRLDHARDRVGRAIAGQPSSATIGDVVAKKGSALENAYTALLGYDGVAAGAERSGGLAGADFLDVVSVISGVAPDVLADREGLDLPLLSELHSAEGDLGLAPGGADETPVWEDFEDRNWFDPFAPTRTGALARMAKRNPWDALNVAERIGNGYQPDPWVEFCIPPNPLLKALRLQAELNLYKLRTCRNIAGMERQLEPFAPTDASSGLPTIGPGDQLVLPGTITIQPTPYRFPVLIERAKQLAQQAAQIEAAMFAAFEKRDAEAYTVLNARQDITLAHAGVRLQDLRIQEAQSGVTLAELQRERAEIQTEHYRDWLREGLLLEEQLSLATLAAAAVAYAVAGVASAAQWWGMKPEQALGYAGQALSTTSSVLSQMASYERRKQEWHLHLDLAEQDVRIGTQQVRIASDQVRVSGQERVIAKIQADHAQATLEFLNTKFTNAELYDWMGQALGQVYGFFLKQATAVAKSAEHQLAFERQEVAPAFIQADYWAAPADTSVGNGTTDRRGLTGSARLLQDIYQLDQYAFQTNKRKLQLSKTISLAAMAPIEFERFRETGVMVFETPLDLFDREFPGHYLRLIHKVRTSVIALIPPSHGIRATLSNGGVSHVVIGPEVFQNVVVRRDPQSVALSSPRDATGLFELDTQPEMLFPFEGTGVHSTWELRMPKAANRFDYRTIADVLVTIEYTALHSFAYQMQVIQTLRPDVSADRPFSFRHQLADQWYDLHNPDQTETPMIVRWTTLRSDFAPTCDGLAIQHVVLYFSRADGQSFEVPVTYLRFTEQGAMGFVGGGAASFEGIISTRSGSAGSWMSMLGKAPMGVWELALPNTAEVRDRFKNKEIEDILFVITYSGRTPAWPA